MEKPILPDPGNKVMVVMRSGEIELGFVLSKTSSIEEFDHMTHFLRDKVFELDSTNGK